MKLGNCFIIGLILAYASKSYSHSCLKIPKSRNVNDDDRYIIEISGNPKGYAPNENYTISLKSNPSFGDNRFIEFTLVVEPQSLHPERSAGHFHLIDKLLTTFNSECPLTVTQTSTVPKESVDVLWQAPPEDYGCVVVKAIALESPTVWFTKTLQKVLCQENEKNEDTLPPVLETCSACNEAKYEVAFQGLWSRNTHPKGFPEDPWKTKLGDVIGASHKYSKSFWQQATLASPGLKLLAEEGNTSQLETELKEMLQNDDIRTIIKARELAHPKITGTSYTVFRVDSENHLISLVSKITPSPDWIVGVSNLDLCLENGSWAASYTFNLYPWDVGTDDGLTYDSPDEPSESHQLIRLIKSNVPNREESPFYDPDGGPIKPLAKLHLIRKKLYEKDCNSMNTETNNYMKITCQLSDWSEWSSCSVTCGKGVRTRDRHFNVDSKCMEDESEQLQETEECDTGEVCDGSVPSGNDCPYTKWEQWSSCNVACGNGTKQRVRVNLSEDDNIDDDNEDNENDEETNNCTNIKETVECHKPPCPFGDVKSDQLTQIVTDKPTIDCKVSRWSIWSPCDTSLPCKKRFRFRERYILVESNNGGKACPSKLHKKRRCKCKKSKIFESGIRTRSRAMFPYYH